MQTHSCFVAAPGQALALPVPEGTPVAFFVVCGDDASQLARARTPLPRHATGMTIAILTGEYKDADITFHVAPTTEMIQGALHTWTIRPRHLR